VFGQGEALRPGFVSVNLAELGRRERPGDDQLDILGDAPVLAAAQTVPRAFAGLARPGARVRMTRQSRDLHDASDAARQAVRAVHRLKLGDAGRGVPGVGSPAVRETLVLRPPLPKTPALAGAQEQTSEGCRERRPRTPPRRVRVSRQDARGKAAKAAMGPAENSQPRSAPCWRVGGLTARPNFGGAPFCVQAP
jgi:hypothetical protein